MWHGKGLSALSRKRTKDCTRSAGQPEAVCGATTQKCCASAGSARPKCNSTGGVPVAPSDMMSHSRVPDSPAPWRYRSKGSGPQARGGVCTRTAKVAGSRISVSGELAEEEKHRVADREATSAICRNGCLESRARPHEDGRAPRPRAEVRKLRRSTVFSPPKCAHPARISDCRACSTSAR